MFLITIFVIPQGKDNTTIRVQAADVLGFATDESVQGDLIRAISHQMADKLFSLSTITKQESPVDTAERMERERFLAMLNTLDEIKKQQILSRYIGKYIRILKNGILILLFKDVKNQ